MIDYYKINGNKDNIRPIAEFGHKDILISGFSYNEKDKEALIFFHNISKDKDFDFYSDKTPDLIFRYKNAESIQVLIDILEDVKKTFKK